MENTNTPILQISYSEDFTIRITWESLEDYSSVGMPGVKDHSFRVECRILHPTGSFTYEAGGIHIETERFSNFGSQLNDIRTGHGSHAELNDPGSMFVFRISIRERSANAELKIREYQPTNSESSLTCGFRVDYDLFVNKLFADCMEFLNLLKEIERLT